MIPIQFNPNQVFDERKYLVDAVAKTYLRKATDDVQHLIPVEVVGDGNCLYNSILLLMNNSMITTSELRVRTVIELLANGAYYTRMYSQFIGPLDIAIKAVCKNYTYSELYEIVALCNLLRCNIRSIYPRIDFREDMEILNNIFRPTSPIIANCSITIFWSHVLNEIDVREQNNMTWNPNHFVPLMSPPAFDDSDNISHHSMSKVVTPEKRTFKNNAPIQVRIPEYQSSPSRRRRSEHSNETGFAQSTATDAIREAQNGIHEQHQSAMEQQIQPNQENLANETMKHRRIQLEKQKQRNQRNRSDETAEERRTRLEKQKQRDQSNRSNEAAEERQTRLENQKQRVQSMRSNETAEERQTRLEKQKQRNQSNRSNEAAEDRQTRLKKVKERAQSGRTSTCNSSYVQYDNGIFLYVNGNIPKFSPANNMWLGDIPPALQGLTIPEEKLISLYRHNSCVIKLHSPFHSTTTAQAALKGNCITFLQSLPNIVNCLPLKLDDLCDTLKVIFVGAHPPERVHLKKILTVRKKKVTEALHWLKKNNILYQNVEINLHNINQLPEDDVPEAIMLTMEQNIGDEETSSERVGYVPDPLADPTESTNSDTIPISNSGVLDVNGSTVTSDEIKNYVLRKIKNDKATEQMDIERLYPTLFCYGYGSPEDKSRPVEIKLREHIRYLLSYNDRRFETNHSFIFVVFNLLQRRDACFHAQLIATKPYFQASAQEIQSLNSNDIEMALNKSAKNTFSSTSNASLHKLLNHIKTIGGRVMGSTYSRTALRTRIHALIYNQGLPSIFLTLNPADIHSPVALYFAGVKLDLDNIQIEQLMTTYKRAEIIASHPVATAKFFHLLITNILDTMIVGGVLGRIKAYFGTVENQGRGSLHLHLLIWLDHDFKPSDLKEKIQNADFREKLKAYLEDIIKEDLDEFKGKRTFENPDSITSFNPFPT
ncbi:unnamed protein product [Rotaria sp. Silwood1]|nr:unnamed protein product [Rotaria sp. Silwood1]